MMAGANLPDEQPAEKQGFWDVLRPLAEQASGDTAPEPDEVTEQALQEARRQLNQENPRRRKARR